MRAKQSVHVQALENAMTAIAEQSSPQAQSAPPRPPRFGACSTSTGRTLPHRCPCTSPHGDQHQSIAGGGGRPSYVQAPAETSASPPPLIRGAPQLCSRRQSFIADGSHPLYNSDSDAASSLRRGLARRSPSCDASTMGRGVVHCAAPPRGSQSAGARVRRWDGHARSARNWDGLRRDPELWSPDGDCLVHLYARGASQRGPSFRVSFSFLKELQCGPMFSLCFSQLTPTCTPSPDLDGSPSAGVFGSTSSNVELFIPAPEDVTKQAAYDWHVTTRNFFAFAFNKPLVGKQMGTALVDLFERMRIFRAAGAANDTDILDYAEAQGYRSYADCPDHALAALYFAEQYRLRDAWIDAFAHCVGMNDALVASKEFGPLSSMTKALITRSCLDMDIQLGRVIAAVRNFLEDEVSPAYLGLTDGGRAHIDRFRSFLFGFYVDKFGYWPPPKGSPFSKRLLKSMYMDFQSLYDYLVDNESTYDIASQKPASGGICVLQNVDSFNTRHKFEPLPHPLPLLPSAASKKKGDVQGMLRSLSMSSKQLQETKSLTACAALLMATNPQKEAAAKGIVRAYARFEKENVFHQVEEHLNLSDARKIRWLLIYGTLQYLISALRAPREVRDAESPLYPLCCTVGDSFPWQDDTHDITPQVAIARAVHEIEKEVARRSACETLSSSSDSVASTIKPDCDRQDYFNGPHSPGSQQAPAELPAPIKLAPLTRTSSSLSIGKRLSFTLKVSQKHSVPVPKPGSPEMLIAGYVDDLNNTANNSDLELLSHVSCADAGLPSAAGVVVQAKPCSASRRSSFSLSRQASALDLTPSNGQSSTRGRKKHVRINLADVTRSPSQTPTLHVRDVEAPASPAISTTSSRNGSSASDQSNVDNSFWSDDTISSSSSSSVYSQPELLSSVIGLCDPQEPKISAAEESGLLGGLVAVEPVPSQIHTSIRTPHTSCPPSPVRLEEFRFSFPQEQQTAPERRPSATNSPESPQSASDQALIGVAISAATSVNTAAAAASRHSRNYSGSSDVFPFIFRGKTDCPSPTRPPSTVSIQSITAESKRISKLVGEMSPIRADTKPIDPAEACYVDIYSSLSVHDPIASPETLRKRHARISIVVPEEKPTVAKSQKKGDSRSSPYVSTRTVPPKAVAILGLDNERCAKKSRFSFLSWKH